jgi:hypothetical protein
MTTSLAFENHIGGLADISEADIRWPVGFDPVRAVQVSRWPARRLFHLGLGRSGHSTEPFFLWVSTRTAQIPCLTRNRSSWATTTGTFVSSTSRRA